MVLSYVRMGGQDNCSCMWTLVVFLEANEASEKARNRIWSMGIG